MSDYWDAVSRAALGLPGSARPRPRSIYESDEPLAAQAGFESVEQEVDAAPASATPAAAANATPLTQPAATEPTRASRETPALSQQQPAQIVSATHERLETRVEVPVSSTDPPASAGDHTEPVSAAPAPTIARLDVNRIETTRTIVEHADSREPDSLQTAAAEPLVRETVALHETQAAPATAVAIAPPPVIVAEPVVPAPERHQPEHEPPPPLLIEIGRIDIRIESEATAPPAPAPLRRGSGGAPSLSEYLLRRSEANR